ncbi:hypothetical protein [Halegenticoccus tardaugens]|uniref:hypothetical protein n=1 Tax=Halegenticoccus tardaugens TaxID=2071624 RepID=UPI00100B3C6A|nr:hypothetical protein [Halegenticoccus tardaugens]
MGATDRIPVTKDTHEELHRLKGPGQTYDDLLQELIWERNRRELAEKAREVSEKDADELTPLDEL